MTHTKTTRKLSELAKRIAVALHCYFYPSLTNERDCVATTISESGLADLEAKLAEAKWSLAQAIKECGFDIEDQVLWSAIQTFGRKCLATVEQRDEFRAKLAAAEAEREEARGRLAEIRSHSPVTTCMECGAMPLQTSDASPPRRERRMARIITDQTHEQDRKVLADLRRQVEELEAFKAAFPPVSDGKIARRMVEDRARAELISDTLAREVECRLRTVFAQPEPVEEAG